MIGRVALLVTFKKAKPQPQSLSRSHIRDLPAIALPPSLPSSLFQPQNSRSSFNKWSFRRQTRLNDLSYGGQLHIKSTP